MPASRRLVLLAPLLLLLPALPVWAEETYSWNPERSPAGPVTVIVSLDEQKAHVYRNGIEIGVSDVSTGRDGFPTPTGVFTILQKDKAHHSNEWNDASMPYTERLTWGGVALHAGITPGYPSSHGCVHLPLTFARDLFGVTAVGTTVAIVDSHTAPVAEDHPGAVLPTTELVGAAPKGLAYAWQPERSTTGPLSLLLSGADGRLHVYRNGIEIGVAGVRIDRPDEPVPMALYALTRAPDAGQGASWSRIGLNGAGDDLIGRLHLSTDFVRQLDGVLTPGTTLFATPLPADDGTDAGGGFTVMASRS